MKKLITIVCVLIVCLTSFPQKTQVVIAEDLPPLRQLTEREELEALVDTYAEMYGVSADQMKNVIACESSWNTTIQSLHTNSGGREQSFGLVQIHLPSHPSVTYEQAIDPVFAIEFMARAYSEGKQWQWTCHRKLYGK